MLQSTTICTYLILNPFISITPSKPLISSGSWLTLHKCDIYYLSAVKYDPATTDLIFIRVYIYPGPGEGDLQLISEPVYFIRVTIYPAAFPHNISRGHYLPGGVGRGGRGHTANFSTHLFLSGSLFTLPPDPTILTEVTIYPPRCTALFWLVSRPLFMLGT
jgi:hypothetical protein